jgi:hypothetical protein
VGRRFSAPGTDPLDAVEMEVRRSVITNPDGSVVFRMDDVEVPAAWSQLATDIVASKYLRKAGVPNGGRETSVKQLIRRVAKTIRWGGEQLEGYFADDREADTFEAELEALLVDQRGAFNSPVWFNCGLWHAYGIDGSGGNFAWDPETDTFFETKDAYRRPQCSACFIQSVDDDLMSIPARTSPRCAVASRSCPAAARARGSCRSSRCSTVPPARRSRAARRGAPRRWSASTWTTRRSSTSSSGRFARRTRRGS